MSVFQLDISDGIAFYQKITGNTVTDITDLVATDGPISVGRMAIGETLNAASALTVEVYDGTNSHYLVSTDGTCWNAKAVTGKQGVRFFDGFIIPKNSRLRVTSGNASGGFDVEGVILAVK